MNGSRCACGALTTLADRPDATVVRHAGIVAKAHAPDTDPTELALRLAVAAGLPNVLLSPLDPSPTPLDGRLVTLWPYGTPVDPDDPDAAPWEAAATLLAHLHRTPAPAASAPTVADPAAAARASVAPPSTAPDPAAAASIARASAAAPAPASAAPASIHPVAPAPTTLPRLPAPAPPPPMRGPVKAARAIALLRAPGAPHPAVAPVLQAWATLPAWARAEAPMPDRATLCHGDLHLGQLVRHPAPDGPWRLIDVDDLGVGVPAWDLARPAAWYACGLLAPDEWTRFLTAYRAAGGPAVPAEGDPWPALDVPARALTAQSAARAVGKAIAADRPLDEVELSLVDACARMSPIPPELGGDFAK
ncbi:phosphotransferase family protein [Streptomyces sp. NPDC059582]|uniref:phosphotransferase family protein n=1 Tax=Streptomyces sp. NPDC059582 TaxID=3346875 RepID=UPI00369734F7